MTIIKSNMNKGKIQAASAVDAGSVQQVSRRLIRHTLTAWLAYTFIVSAGISSYATNTSLLTDSYPDRYTVVKGDTLWGISGKFLRDPWRWPEVWQGNPQVENPDLIYPGDLLVLTMVDGHPVLKALRRETISETVKLSPSPRATRYSEAVPLIDPGSIGPYINSPLVTDANEMKSTAYVVDGFNGHLILGKSDQFYARGIEDQSVEVFRVFKPGRHFVDPLSGESLGWEATHLGDARMLKAGDPSRLIVTTSYEDINIRDRLRPVISQQALSFFTPSAPQNKDVRGVILDTQNRAAELGALSVVAINIGEREGIRSGDVLRVRSQKIAKKDPFTGEKYFIPEENIGLALVFRTFEKVSYAIVTDSNRQVTSGDVLVSPDVE
ncbi:MAG: LysM repeat protein [Arenicella sp.]|jgi:LysM repeat protein